MSEEKNSEEEDEQNKRSLYFTENTAVRLRHIRKDTAPQLVNSKLLYPFPLCSIDTHYHNNKKQTTMQCIIAAPAKRSSCLSLPQ